MYTGRGSRRVTVFEWPGLLRTFVSKIIQYRLYDTRQQYTWRKRTVRKRNEFGRFRAKREKIPGIVSSVANCSLDPNDPRDHARPSDRPHCANVPLPSSSIKRYWSMCLLTRKGPDWTGATSEFRTLRRCETIGLPTLFSPTLDDRQTWFVVHIDVCFKRVKRPPRLDCENRLTRFSCSPFLCPTRAFREPKMHRCHIYEG